MFTVRCHQDLTHRSGLKPVDEAFEALSRMISVCKTLKAPFLHLLSPSSHVFGAKGVEQAKDFFDSVNLKGVRLAWEVRGPMTADLVKLMEDLHIVHSVDISKEAPRVQSDVLYTRIFGKGKHNIYQFTDGELEKLDANVVASAVKRAIISWHGVKMTSDAARFKKFKETGKFIPVTAFTGVDSAKAVLQEDARFPSTRTELIRHQGWKVIDLTAEKRIHLSQLLSRMPEKTYRSIQEVTKELEVFL